MSRKREKIYIIVFFVLILIVWAMFSLIPTERPTELEPVNGVRDLSAEDFTDSLFHIADRWENYPEKLYTPQDFGSGTVTEAPRYIADSELRKIQYATHRLGLKLPPAAVYAMSLKSSDYAMRIFIDGKEIDSVGNPGSSRETTVPRTGERMYTFYTDSGDVEIIVQTANFVHKDSGYPPEFILGLPQNIRHAEQHKDFNGALIIGCLLLTCIYHFALFLLNRRRKVVLLFAICCLLFIFLTNKIIPMAWHDYNWFFALRFEYLVHFLTFGMVAYFLYTLYPKLFNRFVMLCYFGIAAFYCVTAIVFDSTIYTRLLIGFDAVSVALMIYIVVLLAWQARDGQLRHLLSFTGIFVLFLFGVNDILFHNNILFIGPVAGQIFTAPLGMLFFIVCYALTISAELRDSEEAIERAKLEIAEAEARYTALQAQLAKSEGKTERPRIKLSDFNLSERETNVALLMIDGKQRKEIAALLVLSMGTVNTYCSRIYKKTNCSSLADLLRLLGMNEKIEEN